MWEDGASAAKFLLALSKEWQKLWSWLSLSQLKVGQKCCTLILPVCWQQMHPFYCSAALAALISWGFLMLFSLFSWDPEYATTTAASEESGIDVWHAHPQHSSTEQTTAWPLKPCQTRSFFTLASSHPLSSWWTWNSQKINPSCCKWALERDGEGLLEWERAAKSLLWSQVCSHSKDLVHWSCCEKWREGIWECFASFCVWFWMVWEAQHIQIPMSLFKGLFVFIPLLPTLKIKFGIQRPVTDESSGIDFYYI